MCETRAPVKQAKKHGTTVFEGDGSAWDATSGEHVRGCTENPIIRHVAAVVIWCTEFVPASWLEAHARVCSS